MGVIKVIIIFSGTFPLSVLLRLWPISVLATCRPSVISPEAVGHGDLSRACAAAFPGIKDGSQPVFDRSNGKRVVTGSCHYTPAESSQIHCCFIEGVSSKL